MSIGIYSGWYLKSAFLGGILRSCLPYIQLTVIAALYIPDVNVLMADIVS